MKSSASPSHLATPPPPPRHFPLHRQTPFATPLETSTHLSSPSSTTLRSGSSCKSIGSIHVARIADRRGVNLAQVLDFAQAEVSIRGEKRRRRQRLVLAPSLLLPTPDDQTTILAILGDSPNPLTPNTMTTTSPAITSSWSGTGPVPPSGPLPPVDQSFMRWSRTTSIFSDHSAPSTFYFTGRSTGAYSEIHTSSPLPSATDTTFPPSSFPIPMSHPLTNTPPRPRPDPKRRESANSAGTFGDRQRRWSALHSTSGGPAHDDFSPSESSNVTPIDEEVQFGSTSSRTRNGRRPLSMSSASDSFSGPSNVVAERVHIGRSNISGATFPSPTLRRPIHTSPESTADITAHLLKASGKNDSRIVPRLTPVKQAPTVGTPIASEVREEGSLEHREKRKTSKLDQILGEGAETARVLMEFDRRDRKAIHDIVDLSGITPLPPPPRHRPSTAPSPSTIPILPPQTPPTHFGRTDRHTRSTSVDSPPSSPHPSIAESTHTNARLILSHSSHTPSSLVIQPTDKELAKLYAIAKPDLHNDLSPEQRAILVRRTRKIEQMLGEPLSESRVGQHVVRPSTASAVMQTTHDELWPASSSATRTRVPEYDQQDCQPRTVRAAEKPPIPALKGSSKIALKAMAALGLVDKKEEDIRVYVSKETTVTEVVQNTSSYPTARRASEQTTRGTGRAKVVEASDEPKSPKSPIEDSSDSPEDTARRARRTQAAKISRLLGEPVPASALPSHQTDSPRTLSSDAISLNRPNTPQRSHSANGQSFMSIDESTPSPSWAKRMRSAVASVKDRDKVKEKERDKGSSFWDGSLPSKEKGKKGSSPPGFRTWSPSHDQFSGRRDNVQSSFMDMRESRNVSPGLEAAGVGGNYGAKRAAMKQRVW